MTNAGEVGYPNLIFNTHAVVQQIQTAAERLGVYTGKQKVNKDCPSYSVVVAFFDGVVEGLKAMKGKIKWEILQGEMCQTLLSMKLGADTVRPAEFPRRFMRIWQSNVPYVEFDSLVMSSTKCGLQRLYPWHSQLGHLCCSMS